MYALPTGILALGFAEEIRRRDFTVTWRLVAKVPMFAHLDAVEIAEVAQLLHPKLVPPRYVVLRHGEEGDAMYFIISGEVEVDLYPTPRRLGPGAFFGEIALLERTTRTATVTAVTECQLLELGYADFTNLLSTHPALHDAIKSIAEQRLEDLRKSDLAF